MAKTWRELLDDIVAYGWYLPEEIVGCTDEELELISTVQGTVLPQAYIDIMKTIGKTYRLAIDENFCFPQVLRAKAEAYRIILDSYVRDEVQDPPFSLPESLI